MKRLAFSLSTLFVILFLSRCSSPNNPSNNNPTKEQPANHTEENQLNDVFVNLENGATITLSDEYSFSGAETFTIDKSCTITGDAVVFDMKGATFIIKTSGVQLISLKNIKEIIIDEKVGNGDFSLDNSEASTITVNGGGKDSIHISGSSVSDLNIYKEFVRVAFSSLSNITNTFVYNNAILDSNNSNSVIKNVVTKKDVSTLNLKGEINIKNMVTYSTGTVVKIESDNVKIDTATSITVNQDGNPILSEVNFDIASGINPPEIKTNAIKTDLKKIKTKISREVDRSNDITYSDYYEYDIYGNTTKTVTYNDDGSKRSYSERKYTYDENGRVTEWQYFVKDELWNYGTYKYDDNGNRIRSNTYLPNGTLLQYYTYEYNDKGLLTKEYYSGGEESGSYHTEIYEYDENGYMIKSSYETSGYGGRKSSTTYQYDSDGNKIKKDYIVHTDDFYDSEEYKYDIYRNMIRKNHYDEDGLYSYITYEYNAYGKKTVEAYHEPDGTIYSYRIYEYNSNQNLIKAYYYDNDNGDDVVNDDELIGYDEYEYTYW